MAAPHCNLLVTYDVQHREFAQRNANRVLVELGASPRFLEGSPPGVFEVVVPGDARLVARAARELCRQDPLKFAHTHHWRPVELWVESELPAMVRSAEQLGKRIGPGDSWRLTLEIHGPSKWHSSDLVKPLTDPVKGGVVRMDDPAKVLRVDILGRRAGFAVLDRGDELSVDKERQALMAMPQDI